MIMHTQAEERAPFQYASRECLPVTGSASELLIEKEYIYASVHLVKGGMNVSKSSEVEIHDCPSLRLYR